MISQVLLIILYSFFGAILTWLVIEKWIKAYIRENMDAAGNYLSEIPLVIFISGFVEILLYAGSMFVSKPEFIVFWIGLKTALRWDRKVRKGTKLSVTQRGTFHTTLIGTGLNIIFGYVSVSLATGGLVIWQK